MGDGDQAPVFVYDIVTPDTTVEELETKHDKYATCGVSRHFIIDPFGVCNPSNDASMPWPRTGTPGRPCLIDVCLRESPHLAFHPTSSSSLHYTEDDVSTSLPLSESVSDAPLSPSVTPVSSLPPPSPPFSAPPLQTPASLVSLPSSCDLGEALSCGRSDVDGEDEPFAPPKWNSVMITSSRAPFSLGIGFDHSFTLSTLFVPRRFRYSPKRFCDFLREKFDSYREFIKRELEENEEEDVRFHRFENLDRQWHALEPLPDVHEPSPCEQFKMLSSERPPAKYPESVERHFEELTEVNAAEAHLRAHLPLAAVASLESKSAERDLVRSHRLSREFTLGNRASSRLAKMVDREDRSEARVRDRRHLQKQVRFFRKKQRQQEDYEHYQEKYQRACRTLRREDRIAHRERERDRKEWKRDCEERHTDREAWRELKLQQKQNNAELRADCKRLKNVANVRFVCKPPDNSHWAE